MMMMDHDVEVEIEIGMHLIDSLYSLPCLFLFLNLDLLLFVRCEERREFLVS